MNFKDTQNNLHHLDDAQYIYLLPEGSLEITDEEAEAIRISQLSVIPEPTYQELRAAAYPTLQEQLDMQYHDTVSGTTTWVTAISAVKVEYPKPVVEVEPVVVVETVVATVETPEPAVTP